MATSPKAPVRFRFHQPTRLSRSRQSGGGTAIACKPQLVHAPQDTFRALFTYRETADPVPLMQRNLPTFARSNGRDGAAVEDRIFVSLVCAGNNGASRSAHRQRTQKILRQFMLCSRQSEEAISIRGLCGLGSSSAPAAASIKLACRVGNPVQIHQRSDPGQSSPCTHDPSTYRWLLRLSQRFASSRTATRNCILCKGALRLRP